ncbi:MAG: hypothetical protein LBK57_08250 [Clostridiales Family XIII bacterium]|jgi:cell division protein ZapA (FtsZ GTPase activity inhibitor)|nr:hypothetical protein [Clostridiales Family XIII bacterium]
MSSDKPPITKDNLLTYIKELAKDFRKLNGTATTAEIILIGGAAVLASYGFREMTYDIDAVIVASSAMKQAINRVGDKYDLPNGWLNADFKQTASYSSKLSEVSRYYKTFSNILTVRVVAAEYLLAMKLMSGRLYKYDMSDIIGILWEHQKSGEPITRDMIDGAVTKLYGENAVISENPLALLNAVMRTDDYESLYGQVRKSESESKEFLLKFDEQYPDALKSDNINDILSRRKQKDGERNDFLATLDGLKKAADDEW